jgi:peptide/nickel transport system permease protein
MRFILGRLVHALFLLFGVSLLSFGFTELAPGDFFDEMRLDPQISHQTVEAMRSRYGLDQPLGARYIRWLQSVARGNLGFSFSYNSPVGPLLWRAGRNTLLLTVTATAMAWLLAIPLGIWVAARGGRLAQGLFAGGTSLLLAVPDLLLGLGCLVLAARSGLFPTGDMISLDFARLGPWGKLKDLASHLALPVTALGLSMLPVLARHVRASMTEVLDAPFLRAARGFGIPRRRLLFRYALPAAANPLISLFGLSVAGLLSASLLIEVIMSWPGMGRMLFQAILARDVYLVIGAVMFSTLFLVLGNLLADILLHLADPRIRTE